MKKLTGKQLALCALIVAVYDIVFFVLHLSYGVSYAMVSFVGIIVQLLLALAMCRDKNDGFVSAMVLLFCITEIILPILRSVAGGYFTSFALTIILNLVSPCVLIAGLFVRRKPGKGEAVSKVWFIPAVLYLVLHIQGIGIGLLFGILNYLVLGYWLWYELDVGHVQAVNNKVNDQIAYFDDLLHRGIITQEEHDEKIRQLRNN